MPAVKATLIVGLISWMTKGSNGEFLATVSGIDYLADEFKSYVEGASDSLNNKLVAFTASEFKAQLASLTPSEGTSIAANAIATGISLSFTGKSLGVANMPATASAPVSNTIVSPVTSSEILPDIEALLNADHKTSTVSSLANDWADIFEKALKANKTLFSYLGPPPLLLPMTQPGSLS
jgi:hypothetical protein